MPALPRLLCAPADPRADPDAHANAPIAATWTAGELRATNAPFMVSDANGPVWSQPVRVDQNVAPNDFENAGVMWKQLGTVELAPGQTELFVTLSTDGTDGYVIADAVRVVPARLRRGRAQRRRRPWHDRR